MRATCAELDTSTGVNSASPPAAWMPRTVLPQQKFGRSLQTGGAFGLILYGHKVQKPMNDQHATDQRANGMARFAGRVALVVGGAQGIGKAIAVSLGREGARVVIADV